MAMKKTQVYGWHKCSRAVVNNVLRCKWCSGSHLLWIYSRMAYSKQKKCTLKSSVASEMEWEGNIWENGHETTGFFCMTLYLHIGHKWSDSTLSSTMWWLWSIHYIPQTFHHPTFLFSTTNKCSERTATHECWRSQCKSDENIDRGTE
jgi:hypothetical protein